MGISRHATYDIRQQAFSRLQALPPRRSPTCLDTSILEWSTITIAIRSRHRLLWLETEWRIDGRDIASKLGIEEPELTRSIGHLCRSGHIRAIDASGGDNEEYIVRGVSPSGSEALGECPSAEAVAVVMPDMTRDLAAQLTDRRERSLLEMLIENVSTGFSQLLRLGISLGLSSPSKCRIAVSGEVQIGVPIALRLRVPE